MKLSEAEHKRISDVITSTERMTSGEIFCVLAEETDDFRAIPFAWAALVALVIPPILIWTALPVLEPFTGSSWLGGDIYDIRRIVELHAGLSALLFIASFLIARIPAVKRWLTPRSLRQAAVHRTAMESFLAHGIHVTQARTGVLIFLSLRDRVAEVVADESIYKKVDNSVWGDAVSLLLDHVRAGNVADGFVAAIEACGKVLSAHFPPRAHDVNELPDKLIEI